VIEELVHIWADVEAELRRTVSADTFDIWLAPLRPSELDGARLVVQAPVEICSWVAGRYDAALQRAARTVLGEDARLEVVAREDDVRPTAPAGRRRSPRNAARGRTDERRTDAPTSPPSEPPDAGLNPKFTFGQFVIGDANRFAHAAALAVAELPGQAYNPLFIYGPPGVGKTHLLHAVGNYVERYGGGLSVRCTSVERFTNDFVAALHGGPGAIDRFKSRHRHVDVLLIDDVQFLESKVKTEEEFFHTFNALRDAGSQLVLTSDRLPRDMDALHARMRERFEAGLVCDIEPPDPNTRAVVLRKRAQHDGVELTDPGVLDVIADRVRENVRSLEAAFIRVVAYASLTQRPLTAELAVEVLDGLYPEARDRFRRTEITVARVQEAVCEQFSLTREELLSSSRQARVTWPRQIAMFLARDLTAETLPAIGRQFGGRNHTTVMHAIKRTSERLGSDPEAYELVRSVTARLTGA
jgi:chromosomal replication initiator protein